MHIKSLILLAGLSGCTWVSKDDLNSRLSAMDDDGDGITVAGGDCNDNDPDISPEKAETWYDGVDSDCQEDDDYDADKDEHPLSPFQNHCRESQLIGDLHPQAQFECHLHQRQWHSPKAP